MFRFVTLPPLFFVLFSSSLSCTKDRGRGGYIQIPSISHSGGGGLMYAGLSISIGLYMLVHMPCLFFLCQYQSQC